MAISARFFSCYPGMSRGDVARIFKVNRTTVTEWATKGDIPWNKLKYLSDGQAVSWDWILEGTEPKESTKKAKTPLSTKPKFPRAGINRRFRSLYLEMKQINMANALGVTPATVTDWKKNKMQVSWARLEDAVNTFGVRWDWLLDGLEPKYLNSGDTHLT